MPKASTIKRMKPPTVIGILLVVASAYCWYWLHSRGAFNQNPIEIPIHVTEDAPATVSFVGTERGDHYVELEYPADASNDVRHDLERITGNASLSSHGVVLAQVVLPVKHGTYANGRHAIILFTVPTKPRDEYQLSLNLAQIPAGLLTPQGHVKVEADPHYNLIFPQIEVLSVLLIVLALFCFLPGIRRQAGQFKQAFAIVVIGSCVISALGYVGLILLRRSPLPPREWSILHISFPVVVVGAVMFAASILCWFVASLVAYIRWRRHSN